MADENLKPEDRKERKFWGAPLKHMTYGVGLTSLVWALTPFFQTKNDAEKQGTSIAVQANQIVELKNAMEASKNEIISTIKTSVSPIAKDIDRHETRIVNLEFIQMGGKRNSK